MTALETPPGLPPRETLARPRRLSRRKKLIFGVLVLLVIGGIVAAGASKTAPKPEASPAAPALVAHGAVEPVAQATVASMNGGVVRSLRAQVGQTVDAGQVIAQISLPAQTETLVAPWTGTIMGLGVHRGDTIMPGAVVATMGDLSRYQVRTTDVDEYLIGQIRPGQQVSMTVEALDGRKLDGTVETVALAQQASGAGVTNYPVVIRLSVNDPDLRPSMTVRIVFSTREGPS